jgi:hypothetical protein
VLDDFSEVWDNAKYLKNSIHQFPTKISGRSPHATNPTASQGF